MKHLIFIALFSLINISVYAQVRTEVNYDSKSKQFSLKFINDFDRMVVLSPVSEIEPEKACIYWITWQDDNHNALKTHSDYVFIPITVCRIPAKKSRTFVVDAEVTGNKVKYVEIRIHTEVYLYDKKTNKIDRKNTWKDKDFTKIYEY